MAGRAHGPIGAAISADSGLVGDDRLPQPQAVAASQQARENEAKPRPPKGWPGLADNPRRPSARIDSPENTRTAERGEWPPIDELLARAPTPNLSRELIDEVGWWAKNASRMRGDEWLTPRPQSFPAPPAPAPAARPETPKPTTAALLTTAEAQREAGDAKGAARSVGAALAIEVDVPGGIERAQGIAPVLERARRLVSPVASESRQTSPEERAVLEQFDERWRIGERLAAVLELRAFTRTAVASGLAVERLLVAERALSLGRRERVELGGEEITVVFGGAAWLGRSDADIEVRSPLVSRQHLLFAAGEAGPVARDDASANGTYCGTAGPRLELRIERRCELRLGGEIELAIEPIGSRGRHLRVQSPATTTLLALGESLDLAKIALCRWQSGDLAGWRFEAPSGGATLNGSPCVTAELARGDHLAGEWRRSRPQGAATKGGMKFVAAFVAGRASRRRAPKLDCGQG